MKNTRLRNTMGKTILPIKLRKKMNPKHKRQKLEKEKGT